MEIKIPDRLPPHERKRLLKIIPVKYAIEKFFGRRKEIARWLGISERNLYTMIRASKELQEAAELYGEINITNYRLREHLEIIFKKNIDYRGTYIYRYATRGEREGIDKIMREIGEQKKERA